MLLDRSNALHTGNLWLMATPPWRRSLIRPVCRVFLMLTFMLFVGINALHTGILG